MDERDDDLRLPSAAVLETWTVPEPGSDLADRIADAWQDERISRAGLPHRSRLRGVLGVTMGAALGAAAAILVMMLVRPGPADPVEPIPTPTPEAAAVVAPAPAETASARELAQMKADLERIVGEIDRKATATDEFRLVLDVEPEDARVQVTMGGRVVADLLGDARLLLPRGPYEIVAEAEQHEPLQVSGNPTEEPETRHALRLRQQPGARARRDRSPFRELFGRKRKAKAGADSSGDLKNPFSRDDDPVKSAKLRIGTKPGVPPARVYVDGVFIGTTPISAYRVAPGRHTVEWYWADGHVGTEAVDVEADEVRVVKGG
jgi:hypothetical protein